MRKIIAPALMGTLLVLAAFAAVISSAPTIAAPPAAQAQILRVPDLYTYEQLVKAVPATSVAAGTVAYTSDLGPYTSDGSTWTPFASGSSAIAANSILGNNTASSATPAALSPLQTSNLLGSVINVRAVLVAASCAVPTNGTASTADGLTLSLGESILIVQSVPATGGDLGNAVTCGIYTVTSGTWTRSLRFVGAIAQNCDISVFVREGAVFAGHTLRLRTSSIVNIGTDQQYWYDATMAALAGTATYAGTVGHLVHNQTWSGTTGAGVLAQWTNIGSNMNYPYDCLAVGATGGVSADIMDTGNWMGTTGPCVTSDQAGHPFTNGAASPTVTKTGTTATLSANATDNRGSVAMTAVTALTITFGTSFGATASLGGGDPSLNHPGPPSCVISTSTGVQPTSLSVSATAITMSMASFTGTYYYICL